MEHDKMEKLVRMANQIGTFYQRQPHARAVSEIALHMQKFWDPRMRADIYRHLDAGGEGLAPNTREAVAQMKAAEEGRARGRDPAHGATVQEPLEA
jgi:formate dehydrogenase subunit delta